jgi:hypothetical protein
VVEGLPVASDIAAGVQFTCALVGDDEVRCWGRNRDYQLGNQNNVSTHVPQVVESLLSGFAPRFISEPELTARVDQEYRYAIIAQHDDQDPVAFHGECFLDRDPNMFEVTVETTNPGPDRNGQAQGVLYFTAPEGGDLGCHLYASGGGRQTLQYFQVVVQP